MAGMAAFTQRNVPRTFTVMNSSQSAASISSIAIGGMFEPMAALLTRMSSRPNCLSASAIMAPMDFSSRTSARTACAVPPLAVISAATEAQSLVSASTTLAPSAASAVAKIAPRAAFGPAAAPVTTATFPCKRGMVFLRMSAQAGLHQQRIGAVLEFAHLLLVARPAQQHAVEPHVGKLDQPVHHLLAGA